MEPKRLHVVKSSTPAEYLTAMGRLRPTLHVRMLWERRHGSGAAPHRLTVASFDSFLNHIKMVASNWPKGRVEAWDNIQMKGNQRMTVFTDYQNRSAFSREFKAFMDPASLGRRGGGLNYPTLLKDTMPFVPLQAAKVLNTRKGLREKVHESFAEITSKMVGWKKLPIRGARLLNKEKISGKAGTPFFLPFHAVKRVYTPEFIEALVNEGVLIERVVEWSKSPKHVIETLQKLRDEGKLQEHALANLERLGF
ncbi:MAG: hypothetical protein JW834_03175 [Candidatus Diapherotrites archaeon]|nr:hypothetical protein [Candidatus Diapherotrites archaeon]